MGERANPTDLELAALISSKICHDVIGPVGAIYNGLEILDEDDDQEAKNYALDVIRNVTRAGFGPAAVLPFRLRRGRICGRHHRSWHRRTDFAGLCWQRQAQAGLEGDTRPHAQGQGKAAAEFVASAITALPRGGEIEVQMAGTMEKPSFLLRCKGTNARAPLHLTEFIAGENAPPLDAMTIQPYYTWRLAAAADMRLAILQDGDDILLSAKSST